MTEAAFPLLGAAFIVLIVLPACALLAKLGLVLIERRQQGGVLRGLNRRFLLVTGSSALPLAWFFSAGLHQTEAGASALVCLLSHDDATLCFEPGFFSLLLAIGVGVGWARAVRSAGRVDASVSSVGRQLAARIERLVAESPALNALVGRVVVTDDASFAIGTRGFLKARVFVGVEFARAMSDEMLVGALHHECEHLESRDPLRYLLLELALTVNPFGRFLLEPHVARWKAAREAHCDREAVLNGAAPLALADAIVRAARPSPRETAALGYSDVAVLKLRVSFLLAFAERTPERCCDEGRVAIPMVALLLLVTLLLPHQAGTDALDAVHLTAEHMLAYLSR